MCDGHMTSHENQEFNPSFHSHLSKLFPHGDRFYLEWSEYLKLNMSFNTVKDVGAIWLEIAKSHRRLCLLCYMYNLNSTGVGRVNFSKRTWASNVPSTLESVSLVTFQTRKSQT